MAAGAEFCHHITFIENGYGNDKDSSPTLNSETTANKEDTKQMRATRPPRETSVMRHCLSSARLAASSEMLQETWSLRKKTSSRRTKTGPEMLCVRWAWWRRCSLFCPEEHTEIYNRGRSFFTCLDKAIKSAFLRADHAFVDAHSLDSSSGTTALTALIFGRKLYIANVGDCRAVLSKRGRAIELSRDHKPSCISEKLRIEKLGGKVYDGYLNGQLSVARALGDWHMKGPKGTACPLSAEPELQEAFLTEEDEFLILGFDGLWNVMNSQCAVTIARKELMQHNDAELCSKNLVREALKRNTCDNLTVVVVCFSSDPPPRIEIARSRVRRSISLEGLNFLQGVLDSNE